MFAEQPPVECDGRILEFARVEIEPSLGNLLLCFRSYLQLRLTVYKFYFIFVIFFKLTKIKIWYYLSLEGLTK